MSTIDDTKYSNATTDFLLAPYLDPKWTYVCPQCGEMNVKNRENCPDYVICEKCKEQPYRKEEIIYVDD